MAKRRQKAVKRRKVSPGLASLFKMTRDELQTRRQSGGGVHRPKTAEHMPRSRQKRLAIDEQQIN